MRRGEKAMFISEHGRRTKVEVVHDHSVDPEPFPAVTIIKCGEECIVGRKELMSKEDLSEERKQKEAEELAKLEEIVSAYKQGHHTLRDMANHINVQMADILSKALKAERMGLIKMERTGK